MRDTRLYQQILGLTEPWFVEKVELKMDEGRVDVFVEHVGDAKWSCAICGKACGLYDHSEERVWRHLDSCQLKTFLHARVPRTGSPEHGIHKVKLPWAETRSRFTLLMERLIIDVIRQCSTISGTCAVMRVSWDEALGVMQRAVERGQERKQKTPVKYLGVDEKAFRKGHSYLTVVCDLERSTVEHVAEDRTTESLAAYWPSLTQDQRETIEAVAMLYALRRIDCPRCGVKVERVPWCEPASKSPMTTAFKVFLSILKWDLRTVRAYILVEGLQAMWEYRSPQHAGKFLDAWCRQAMRSRLEPIKKVARSLREHRELILNWYRARKRYNAGIVEGLNLQVKLRFRKAFGFRTVEAAEIALYHQLGRLPEPQLAHRFC